MSPCLQKKWIQKFLHGFRACLFCSSITNSDEILCAACWRKLKDKASLESGWTHIAGLSVGSLFAWRKDEDVLISMLLRALKNNADESDWRPLAQMMREHLWGGGPVDLECPVGGDSRPVLVPAPASNPNVLNHAESLAQELGSALDLPVISPLRWPTGKSSQKRKKRRERARVHMRSDEKISDFAGEVLFVDDILTTGATARAAHRALGRPEKFRVLCLARRFASGFS